MADGTSVDVVVIGGGLAGGCTAYSLARRGYSVAILDREQALAQRASGNRYGLVTPYIASSYSPLQGLYEAGYAFSSSMFASDDALSSLFTRCGAIQVPSTTRLRHISMSDARLLGAGDLTRVDSHEASALANIEIRSPGIYIPSAGFISPARLLHELVSRLNHAITFHGRTRVSAIHQQGGTYTVQCDDGRSFSTPHVVLCGAYESAMLEVTSWLPLEPIRGQTITLSSNASSQGLRTVLCFGGYATPAVAGEHLLGAHYRHGDLSEAPSHADSDEIIRTCNEWIPALSFTPAVIRSTRVCFRTSTIDRLPYIGRLPDFRCMEREASRYQPGTDLSRKIPVRHTAGLFIHAGHGSRGLLSCPLGGEIVARLINQEPLAELEAVAAIVCADRLPHRLLHS